MTIESQLEILIKKIENLENKIENLERKLDNIHKETQRMDSHVTFVENIYQNVKSPFHYLMNKVNIVSNLSIRN